MGTCWSVCHRLFVDHAKSWPPMFSDEHAHAMFMHSPRWSCLLDRRYLEESWCMHNTIEAKEQAGIILVMPPHIYSQITTLIMHIETVIPTLSSSAPNHTHTHAIFSALEPSTNKNTFMRTTTTDSPRIIFRMFYTSSSHTLAWWHCLILRHLDRLIIMISGFFSPMYVHDMPCILPGQIHRDVSSAFMIFLGYVCTHVHTCIRTCKNTCGCTYRHVCVYIAAHA